MPKTYENMFSIIYETFQRSEKRNLSKRFEFERETFKLRSFNLQSYNNNLFSFSVDSLFPKHIKTFQKPSSCHKLKLWTFKSSERMEDGQLQQYWELKNDSPGFKDSTIKKIVKICILRLFFGQFEPSLVLSPVQKLDF